MTEEFEPMFRLRPTIATALALGGGVCLAIVDFLSPANIYICITYAFPIIMCAWIRSRPFLWTMVLCFVVLTYADWQFGRGPIGNPAPWLIFVNRSLAAVGIVITGMIVHLWLSVRDMLEFNQIMLRQRDAEFDAHEMFAAQEHMLVRQRDVLEEQVVDLKRQCAKLEAALKEQGADSADSQPRA